MTREELTRLAFAAAPTAAVVVEADGRITLANVAAESLFGVGPGELHGVAASSMLPGLAGEILATAPPRADSGRRWHSCGVRRRDGALVTVDATVVLADQEQGPIRIVWMRTRPVIAPSPDGVGDSMAFERLLADIAASFVNVPIADVDARIVDGLRLGARILGAERGVLWLPIEGTEAGDLEASHHWTAETWPLTGRPPNLTAARYFPWLLAQLQQGVVVAFDDVDDIPSDTDRASFALFGTRSTMSVPLVPGEMQGVLVLGSSRRIHWTPYAIERLPLLASVFVNALAMQRSRVALDAALAELERVHDQLHVENVHLRSEVKALKSPRAIVTDSAAARALVQQVEQVAPMPVTVLLLGETGTGKEVFAEAIHESSPRRHKPMVRVNCAAIPGALLESELFGRERGAYTGALARQLGRFELANDSTIFLDEIGDLPSEVQVKLLRVLQDHVIERLGNPHPLKVNVRVIAATHVDLDRAVAEGRFREDLYYRLNVFPIRIPPLRERVEDIPALVWAFIGEFATAFGKRVESLSKQSLQALLAYPWPGNVRELRNVIERALVLANGPHLVIDPPHVGSAGRRHSLKLVDVEADHIRAVLDSTEWRIRGEGGAADLLGVKPTTLESRMAKLGIVRRARAVHAATRP